MAHWSDPNPDEALDYFESCLANNVWYESEEYMDSEYEVSRFLYKEGWRPKAWAPYPKAAAHFGFDPKNDGEEQEVE